MTVHRSIKTCRTILLIILFLTLLTGPVFAHRMLIKPLEPGRLQIIFDDLSLVSSAQVVFLDKDNNEIYTATSDAEGYVSYDPALGIARVVADDGLGHKATWQYGTEFKMPMSLKVRGLIGIAILAVLGGFFHYRTKGV